MPRPLSSKELAGVTAVGLALGYAGAKLAQRATTPSQHFTAMIVSGAALYVLGVKIGTSRPPAGWIAG